jgi:hypothetical protein
MQKDKRMPPRKPPVSEIQLAGDGDIEITRVQNRNYALGEGFRRCVYLAQAERHDRRAVEEFERPKALRPELPNEANFDPNPNQTQPLVPHEDGPISPVRPPP